MSVLEIWVGFPPNGSVVVCERLLCVRHVAVLDLIVRCLRLRRRSRFSGPWVFGLAWLMGRDWVNGLADRLVYQV